MRPRIAWADPPMSAFFLVAFVGGLGTAVANPSWWVAARVTAEAAAFLLCLRGIPLVWPPAVFAAASLALTGHAASVHPEPAGAVFADALHVLAAAMWGGGVLALFTLRPPGGWRSVEARLLVERFGRVAVIAFGVTALSGFLRATEELNGLGDLWTTSYGVVLALKVALVVALIVGSAAWRRGWAPTPALTVIAVLIVLATALLAAIPPPPISP